MKKSMWRKIRAFCTACILMVSSVPVTAEESKNGDFSEVNGSIPLHWELGGGAEAEIPFRTPAGEEEERCQNGSFESGTDVPTGWTAYWGPWNGAHVRRKTAAARSGQYGVEVIGISTDEMTVYQNIENPVIGAEYQISAYIKTVTTGAKARLTVSQYADGEILRTDSVSASGTTSDWEHTYGAFTIMEACTSVSLAFRINGEGTVYLDDFSFYMTKAPAQFFFETEDIFHYAERGRGTAHVRLNPYYEELLLNPTVDFTITDQNGNVLAEKKNEGFANGAAKWEYSVADFEMYEEYTLSMTARGGGETETFVQDIYKYPRPTAIREDGTYTDENGNPFIPVIAYHPGDFSRMQEIGVNVVEISAPNVATTLQALESCKALGIKALVSLFCGPAYMMPAAHPDNINTTMEVVEAVHDHPAVFAYAVQDEPYGGEPEQMDAWLTESYKMIHSIDKVHPVYAVDFNTGAYRRAGKRVDVLATDLYPYQDNAYKVTDSVRAAVDAVYGRKPVYCITQVFEGVGYFPTADAVRAQVYRALAEGAHGIGFYAISNAIGHWGGKEEQPLYELDRWEGMTAFADAELKILLDHFGKGGDKLFSMQDPRNNSGVYFRGWAKDGKLYFALHNRNAAIEEVSIPLQSDNGKITVNGYGVKRVNPPEPVRTVSGSTFSVSMEANACALYEITPGNSFDEALLDEAVRKPAMSDEKPTSMLKADKLPTETERENAAICLFTKGASIQQHIYALSTDKNYLLTVDYESGVSESVKAEVDFYVRDVTGYHPLQTWKTSQGFACISGEETYEEKFGTGKGADTYSVDFSVPEHANAVKLTISAQKTDAKLKIRSVSLRECEKNLLANGSLSYRKSEDRLSGGWTAYYEYAKLYKNTVELRKENDLPYLYMTEAETYKKGTSANVRQKVALYRDKLYMLSFLYKDMGEAGAPTAGASTASGRCLARAGTTVRAADGWTRYTICIRPLENAMHTIWFGGPDTEGAYAYADIQLSEIDKKGVFLSPVALAESAEGAPALAKRIDRLDNIDDADGFFDVLLWQEKDTCVCTYGAEGKELVDFTPLSGQDGWTKHKVPVGGKLRVFVWQARGMQPSKPCETLQ